MVEHGHEASRMIHGLVSPAFTITRLLVLTMSKATHKNWHLREILEVNFAKPINCPAFGFLLSDRTGEASGFLCFGTPDAYSDNRKRFDESFYETRTERLLD